MIERGTNRIFDFQELQPEINVLNKYGNIDNLAIKLYNNNIIDPNVWEDLMKIFHVEMGIDFYLNPFLDKVDNKQIVGVLSQHSLSKDYEKLFGSKVLRNIHSSKQMSAHISDEGRKNLAKAFYFEFDAIKKLNSVFPIEEEKLARLLKWHSTEVQ